MLFGRQKELVDDIIAQCKHISSKVLRDSDFAAGSTSFGFSMILRNLHCYCVFIFKLMAMIFFM